MDQQKMEYASWKELTKAAFEKTLSKDKFPMYKLLKHLEYRNFAGLLYPSMVAKKAETIENPEITKRLLNTLVEIGFVNAKPVVHAPNDEIFEFFEKEDYQHYLESGELIHPETGDRVPEGEGAYSVEFEYSVNIIPFNLKGKAAIQPIWIDLPNSTLLQDGDRYMITNEGTSWKNWVPGGYDRVNCLMIAQRQVGEKELHKVIGEKSETYIPIEIEK